jgi:aminopeptidase
MTDSRYGKLASLLVEYSTELKKGDRILLDMIDAPDEFSVELVRAVRKAGATPIVEVRHGRVTRELLLEINDAQAALIRDLELARMKKMQAYIAVRGSANASENADVPSERMALYSRVTRPLMNYRVNQTRWCVLRLALLP